MVNRQIENRMVKKIGLTIGLLCCMMMSIHAQTTVESIRERYNGIKSTLADMMMEDGMPAEYCQLHLKQNLPATGPHFEDVLLYWGDDEDDDDVIYPNHHICYAQTNYNFAARKFYEEYLYDDKGNLIFIYARNPDFDFDNGIIYDFRFYLTKGKVMNVIVKSSADGGKTFKDVYTGKTVPKEYTEQLDEYLSSAKRYKALFESIDDCTSLL